jgi:predicted AAA+ superfamily ATPase
VRDLARIEGLTELPDLLRLLAARIGSLLNFAELSRSARLTRMTLKRYFGLLEQIFLVGRCPAWSANLSKRLVRR